MDFIAQHKDRPFFCYLPFNTPHSPMQVPDASSRSFEHADPKMRGRDPQQEEIPMTRAVLAMCENIDWNVGRVLAKLDELKLARQHHRDLLQRQRAQQLALERRHEGPQRIGGRRRRARSVPDPLARPHQARHEVPQIAGAIDLLPTLADMAGIRVASHQAARRQEPQAAAPRQGRATGPTG